MKIVVVIPAYNEAKSIAQVIAAIPDDAVERIIVVDNASTDETAAFARDAGAHVVYEPRRGYGSACLRGIAEAGNADIIAFLDADYSDDPSKLHEVLYPIINDEKELVIGSRILGVAEPGALP
ncbi:glycosyltransferase family 2 protein, partial [bacterium]|nr:glycosyltransferase family 2 protein [bacterium]